MSVFLSFLWIASPFLDPQEQMSARSPAHLVRLLLGQAGETVPGIRVGGAIPGHKAAALELVAFGPAALPQIKEGLDLVESRPHAAWPTSRVQWLLYAFARIERRGAYARLNAMLTNHNMSPFLGAVERALAISLQLTSFRSSLRGPEVPSFFLCGAQEVLHQLVLSWIVGDRAAFEATLTTQAKESLKVLLKSRDWQQLRQTFLGETSEPVVTFGYRLPLHPNSLRSLDPLDTYAAGADPAAVFLDGVAEVEAAFFKGDKACARVRIRLEDQKDENERRCLSLIGNQDIERLLGSLSRCVARPRSLESLPN